MSETRHPGELPALETAVSRAYEDGRERLVPRLCTLEGFAQEATRQGGVDLTRLEPLTPFRINTLNTSYELTLIHPGELSVLVRGGRFFPASAEAHLCGSSYGGTLLKMAWIGLGMRMELLKDGRRIVTSPVMSIERLDESHLPGPF